MAVEKRIPLRQCLGCREMKPKAELVRVIRTPEGEITLDGTGKANGRGAYVCRSRSCLDIALKKKSIDRALGSPVPEEIRNRLLEEMEAER